MEERDKSIAFDERRKKRERLTGKRRMKIKGKIGGKGRWDRVDMKRSQEGGREGKGRHIGVSRLGKQREGGHG